MVFDSRQMRFSEVGESDRSGGDTWLGRGGGLAKRIGIPMKCSERRRGICGGWRNPWGRRSQRLGERTPEAEKRARLRNPSRRGKMKEEERKVGILDLGIWELGFWNWIQMKRDFREKNSSSKRKREK